MSKRILSSAQTSLVGGPKLLMDEAVELTVQSLHAYGPLHEHWAIAWSGGKDSTATLALIVDLIDAGRIVAPRSLIVFYADTRLELPPLAIAAQRIMAQLRARGIVVRVVRATLDKRFMVYMLGRGVPPPNNNTLRWCTRQIKVDPMAAALEAELAGIDGQILMITGVRTGESAQRDARIALSCGRDGAECGQGWYQQVLPEAKGVRGRLAVLAPLLHWRVCNVWDYLMFHAPANGWATADIADAYGGDEAEEVDARTGCIGCPLASREKALEAVLRSGKWSYLEPLRGLKPLYRELRLAKHRKRKAGAELLKNGDIAANPQRMGPIKLASRLYGLERVLDIQARCNAAANHFGRPVIDILDGDEEARIRELIAARAWPQKWSDEDPDADVPLDAVFRDGTVQPLLTSEIFGS